MLTKDGPRVIEFNVRFGDPEAQALLPAIEGDFAGALMAAAKGELDRAPKNALGTFEIVGQDVEESELETRIAELWVVARDLLELDDRFLPHSLADPVADRKARSRARR